MNDPAATLHRVRDMFRRGLSRYDEPRDVRGAAESLYAAMQRIVDTAERENRGLTEDEHSTVEAISREAAKMKAHIGAAEVQKASHLEEARGELARRGRLPAGEVRTNATLPEGRGFTDLPGYGSTEPNLLGRYVRAQALGRPDEFRDEFGTGDAGGGMLPRAVLGQVMEAARAESRVAEAGARLVPLEEGSVRAAIQEDDPTPGWRAESASIPESTPTVTSVEFAPKSLAVVSRISWEVLEDASPDASSFVQQAISSAIAQEWDRAALLGDGSGEEPEGLNAASLPEVDVDGPITYDALLDGIEKVRLNKHTPGRYITSVADAMRLARAKDSQDRYLDPPAALTEGRHIPALWTQKLDDAGGGMAFVGDWSKLLLGVRMELSLRVLTERYASEGQVGVVGWFRGDVKVARTDAFAKLANLDT